MATDDKIRNDPDSGFSYAVRELRQAQTAPQLSVASAPLKAANVQRGFDPYNTSGSFDRTKNWARVGKR